MPRLDGTGPIGQGPMTGRGFGQCGGGMARGGGLGFGWKRCMPMAWRQPAKEDLEGEKKYLEAELEAVNEELKKLKK
ncbi:MAG TPA: DUF5320 domain-containing protein [Patescibacteria group bacterium]|nr:DUF5320 domain-containing protein [Patescibacteria group bacterium]